MGEKNEIGKNEEKQTSRLNNTFAPFHLRLALNYALSERLPQQQ